MPTPIPSPSTPLKRRAPSKKHATIADSPTDEASPLRPSSKMNRINDDAAERAARRKSAHFAAELGKENTASPSKHVMQQRKASGKASASASAGAGTSGHKEHHRRGKRMSAVAPVAMPVSMEVMNTNFEEWMKLATDNKITATNTWNFALIDYFHDLTLLRNGPDDQSINFQKASCTLDGCVKIWTSRVDSVATETGKLLSGLADGGDGDVDDEGEDGEDDETGEPKARKTQRSEATLAKSFGALQIKKFDLEFTVDPLFKKTSADFDEGGAMGLLMNHLGIDGTGRVVFDAGDAVVDEDEDEDDAEMEDQMVDISQLRETIPSEEVAAGLTISETLGSFHFSANPDDMPDLAAITGLSSFTDDDPSRAPSMPPGTGEAVDFFGDEDFDMGGPSMGDDMSIGGDDGGFGLDDVFAGEGAGGGAGGSGSAPFDGRRPGQDLFMSFVDGNDNDGMFDYFDRGFSKGWAGAEHWKLRKVTRKDPAAMASAREKKAAKAPFTIDFMSDEGAQSTKVLFVEGSRSAIQLAGAKRGSSAGKKGAAGGGGGARREEYLLPADMHFSSRQLLRLFLKPKFALRRRSEGGMGDDGSGEIDENFWAQAAADGAGGHHGDADGMDMDMGAPLPFESQFFHDDGDADDDAFVDDNLESMPPEEADDLWHNTQGEQLRRARPENVHYAKKAKRVDVKRLKDDIWSGLKSLVSERPETEDTTGGSDAEEPPQPTTPTDTEQVKTFDSVIQSLRTSYPKDKMGEISTSFCFICLLHLANEEGLRLETARTDGNDGLDVGLRGYADDNGEPTAGMPSEERDARVVGELQALKVYKDPTAGRAA